MSDNLGELKEWVSREEADIDYVTAPAVHRLAATLDLDEAMPKPDRPISIQGAPDAGGHRAMLWALDDGGALALSADAEFP